MVSPIGSVGKSAKQIEMSIAVMTSSTALTKLVDVEACRRRSRNFIRFSEARLHEVLSRLMYSEHGLDAVIRPVSGLVCQSLIVSSYWMPGSAHSQAACGDLAEQRLGVDGLDDLAGRCGPRRPNSAPSSTARMNSSVTRTELLAFWYWTLSDVLAAEVHVEAGVAQRADLVLLARLGLDELLDVGVVDVEDDHLGRAPGGAAGLDGAGARRRRRA